MRIKYLLVEQIDSTFVKYSALADCRGIAYGTQRTNRNHFFLRALSRNFLIFILMKQKDLPSL